MSGLWTKPDTTAFTGSGSHQIINVCAVEMLTHQTIYQPKKKKKEKKKEEKKRQKNVSV